MRKKQIQQVIDGRVVPAEKKTTNKNAKVSRTNHERMRQRDWEYAILGSDELQHFKSL